MYLENRERSSKIRPQKCQKNPSEGGVEGSFAVASGADGLPKQKQLRAAQEPTSKRHTNEVGYDSSFEGTVLL